MFPWPQASSLSVNSGVLLSLGQGAASRETRALLPLPTCGGGGGSPTHTHLTEALCSPTLPRIFSSSEVSVLKNRVGLGASLGPVQMSRLLGFCPSPGWCWCWCILAKRTTKEVFSHCLWPGALASVCFENLRWALDPPGHVLLYFRALVSTRQPWGSYTRLFELHLNRDSRSR